jgi:hypothetical protein
MATHAHDQSHYKPEETKQYFESVKLNDCSAKRWKPSTFLRKEKDDNSGSGGGKQIILPSFFPFLVIYNDMNKKPDKN